MGRDYLLTPTLPDRPLHTIVMEVCIKHGVTVDDLLSRRCNRRIAWARQEGYWRARNETPASYPEIAKAFHRGDHTTISYGVKRYEERLNGAA